MKSGEPKKMSHEFYEAFKNELKATPSVVTIIDDQGEPHTLLPPDAEEDFTGPSQFNPNYLGLPAIQLSVYRDPITGICWCLQCNRYGCWWVPCAC